MTHVGRERYASENLQRQGYEVYQPRVLKQVRHARKSEIVMRPLFPSYLFVRGEPGQIVWRPLNSTFGVRKLVMMGDRPAALPNGFVEQLRAREIDGAIARPVDPFKPGEKVRIVHGALEGAIAQVLAVDEKDRVIVLLELLQRQFESSFAVQALARGTG